MLAALLLVSMVPTAMAYTATRPGTADADGNYYTTNIKHTLSLTDMMTELEDGITITYKFAVVENSLDVLLPEEGFKNQSQAVTGAPTIADIVYNQDTSFGTTASNEQPLTINWKNVSIMEPGLYTWKVTKSVETTGTTDSPSNSENDNGFYIWAYAAIDSGTLKVMNTGLARSVSGSTLSDKDNLEDQYPEKKVSLSVGKNVSGTMASTEQYFKFSITLNTVASETPYTITYTQNGVNSTDYSVPATAYHDEQTDNPASVTVTTTPTTVTMWLKHGQVATINGLPYGSSYTILEGDDTLTYSDFTISATINESGDQTDVSNVASTRTVSDNYLTRDTTVTYTNTKNATVPTGITLNTAAPMAGILLAISLLGILFIGKRKEYAA